MSETLSSVGGSALRRIRTPLRNDVLSGRGGGINSHPGNVTFRSWVAPRRARYNLAPYKQDKQAVAQEVIDLVTREGGRFLQRDPTGVTNWWTEVSETKRMAKTCQALREGAPQIRATASSTIGAKRSAALPVMPRKKRRLATSPQVAVTASPIASVRPLVSNRDFYQAKTRVVSPMGTPVRTAAPLMLADLPPLDEPGWEDLQLPTPSNSSTAAVASHERDNSLFIPSLDGPLPPGANLDFVNPFVNEEEFLAPFFESKEIKEAKRQKAIAKAGTEVDSSLTFSPDSIFDKEDSTDASLVPAETAELYRRHNEELLGSTSVPATTTKDENTTPRTSSSNMFSPWDSSNNSLFDVGMAKSIDNNKGHHGIPSWSKNNSTWKLPLMPSRSRLLRRTTSCSSQLSFGSTSTRRLLSQ